ncbi:MAG TPA: dihydrofolate reductase family protein [Terriglobia bacterium]|nr:dihydrofolate reductase family protein [Terriglobia bacterium]
MRKVTFGAASSLDNFLARKDHALDWLMWGDEAATVMSDYWKTIDTVLMGRKTYDIALRHSKGKSPYPGMRTSVFSRTLKDSADGSVTIVSGDAGAFVRQLKHEEGKDICLMGGGELAKSLFESGLIDEIGFNIHPVLLGSGIPLFHEMTHQVNLELLQCKASKNGCVFLRYRLRS